MLVDVSRIECVSEWKWLIVSWLITNWLTSWRLLNWMCWFLDFFLWLLELLERFTAVSVSNKCFWANLLNSTFMIDYLESIIKMLFWTRNRFRLVFFINAIHVAFNIYWAICRESLKNLKKSVSTTWSTFDPSHWTDSTPLKHLLLEYYLNTTKMPL